MVGGTGGVGGAGMSMVGRDQVGRERGVRRRRRGLGIMFGDRVLRNISAGVRNKVRYRETGMLRISRRLGVAFYIRLPSHGHALDSTLLCALAQEFIGVTSEQTPAARPVQIKIRSFVRRSLSRWRLLPREARHSAAWIPAWGLLHKLATLI
jgi:hypothetical protein